MKRTRLNPISKKRRTRVGKVTGTVRLVGDDLTGLRWEVFQRAKAICEMNLPGCLQFAGWKFGHLCHKKSKGSGGPDTLENTFWGCYVCHSKSHNCNGKPCPPKVRL